MAETIVDDRLWENFHRAVNMTSRDLRQWLAVQGAGETTETEPDRAGSELGHRVVDVLGKRRSDLTPDDVDVMQRASTRSPTCAAGTPASGSRPRATHSGGAG